MNEQSPNVVDAENVTVTTALAAVPKNGNGHAHTQELAVADSFYSVEQVIHHVELVREILERVLIPGEHYGKIPGAGDKVTLYKAGAEKLLFTFRIAADLEVEDLSTPQMIRYRVKARAISLGGHFLGSGIGECSTAEEKYAWRSIRAVPEYDTAVPQDRRIKYTTNQKNMVIETKQVRTNPWDYSNTVLKMAKKRAIIDMCLTVLAASDIFAQDMEDAAEAPAPPQSADQGAPPAAPPTAAPPTAATTPQVTQPAAPQVTQVPPATPTPNPPPTVHDQIRQVMGKLGATEADLKLSDKGFRSIEDIPADRAAQLLANLQNTLLAKSQAV